MEISLFFNNIFSHPSTNTLLYFDLVSCLYNFYYEFITEMKARLLQIYTSCRFLSG